MTSIGIYAGNQARKTASAPALEVKLSKALITTNNPVENRRTIVTRTVQSTAEAELVHVLFINGGEKKRGAFDPARCRGVLTVSESETFPRSSSMINFAMEGDKVRFEFKIQTAQEVWLKISAQLQKLAKVARRKN